MRTNRTSYGTLCRDTRPYLPARWCFRWGLICRYYGNVLHFRCASLATHSGHVFSNIHTHHQIAEAGRCPHHGWPTSLIKYILRRKIDVILYGANTIIALHSRSRSFITCFGCGLTTFLKLLLLVLLLLLKPTYSTLGINATDHQGCRINPLPSRNILELHSR